MKNWCTSGSLSTRREGIRIEITKMRLSKRIEEVLSMHQEGLVRSKYTDERTHLYGVHVISSTKLIDLKKNIWTRVSQRCLASRQVVRRNGTKWGHLPAPKYFPFGFPHRCPRGIRISGCGTVYQGTAQRNSLISTAVHIQVSAPA